MMEFIGRPVEVEWVQEAGWKRPVTFVWDGRTWRVKAVVARWDDYGFGVAAPSRKKWYQRRHRTCYEVETEEGERFHLYLDRAGGRRHWVLLGRLVPPGALAPAGGGEKADLRRRRGRSAEVGTGGDEAGQRGEEREVHPGG